LHACLHLSTSRARALIEEALQRVVALERFRSRLDGYGRAGC